MRALLTASVLVTLVPMGSAACRSTAEPAAKRYPLKGVVASTNRALREAVVAHEDIAGFMPAMTMPFPVANDKTLAELQRGDEISATLVVGETQARLEDVKITRRAEPGVPPAKATPLVVEPNVGDPPPDVTLTNQDGKTIRLSDYRGQALAITFLFTRCPLPDFCPRVASQLAAAEAQLEVLPELAPKVHFLAVSFDPSFDTPEVLRVYGKRFVGTRGFGRFELATGAPAEVKRLADFLTVEYEEDVGGFTHNLRTAVVGPDGGLFRLYRGNDWTPAALLADLQAAVAP